MHKTTNWKCFITIWQDQTIFKSNEYNMLWASAHSFSCNCFKFSPISQAVVLGLNFNGFPLWHLKGVHRGGNSSLLLLTNDNFPLGTIHKIHVKQTMTEAEHNRPKLFSNRPSASAAEVFGLLREPNIFFWK